MVEVDKRGLGYSHTINKKKYIRPGSIIHSDEWKGYDCIPNIPSYNYAHSTVNHSRNFVNPITGLFAG